MSYWRIYHYINARLLSSINRGYLEIGAMAGLNIRKIKSKDKFCSSEFKISRDWTNYQWQMRSDDFCSLVAHEFENRFEVVYLREWAPENFEERVKILYKSLNLGGVLIVHDFDVAGMRNDVWKFAVSLKNNGIQIKYLKDQYLLIYKSETELPEKLVTKMKIENYLRNFKKTIEAV
jgi:hypothetical protein